ncbi:MAG TPA: hypothetical protein VGD37_24610 [Kofleriaceae bacterium]|jgi:hypothetical protein
MTEEERQEFAYHLRELHADLGLIRRDFETAASSTDDRSVLHAWTGAWALLEHDLEVHLPRALALLGKTLPPFQPPHGRRSGEAAVPASAAREARRLVDLALAALPPDDIDPPLATTKLADVAGTVHAAYQISDEMLKAVSPDAEEEGASE